MQDKEKAHSAEGFVGSVFKYSISTVVNLGIYAVAMVLTGWLVEPSVYNQIDLFIIYTQTIMTVVILGLDQALMRFYYKPPARLSGKGVFRLCFYLSSAAVVVGGAVCSTLLLRPLYNAIGFSAMGYGVIPLVFLNAFFYMVARYFSVLYRMEGNLPLYTVQSILMQFFLRLFYVLGLAFGGANPAAAMMLCSVLGLGGFALVFGFMRRKTLRPRLAEFTSGGYKTLLPYGFAVAPTAVFVIFNNSISKSVLTHMLGGSMAGVYGYAYQLSNVVAMVQLGFAAYWGPYMFQHFDTQQARIKRVHNYLNLVVLVFFAALVAFEDIIFLVFPKFAGGQPIFPLMMLSAVFTILCETTVYGNAIARRPIFDTIGIGLSFAVNIALVALLAPRVGLYGAAIAIAAANFVMFLFRTATAQRLYVSIGTPGKTVAAVALAVALAGAGTVFAGQFWLKLLAAALAGGLFCLLYRAELVRLVKLGLGMLQKLLGRAGAPR